MFGPLGRKIEEAAERVRNLLVGASSPFFGGGFCISSFPSFLPSFLLTLCKREKGKRKIGSIRLFASSTWEYECRSPYFESFHGF